MTNVHFQSRPILGAANLTAPAQDNPWVHASCASFADDTFYPENPDKDVKTASAKRVCFERCSIREFCLSSALANDERFGIWGGLDEAERQQLAASTCGSVQSAKRHYKAGEPLDPACLAAYNAWKVERRAAQAASKATGVAA